jgi:hypothetical protein
MFDRMVEVYEEYKDLRRKNDSVVEFKYVDASAERGPSGQGGGAAGSAGGPPGRGDGGAAGAMPGMGSNTGSGTFTETYDFSNIMSEEMLIVQTQKVLNPRIIPSSLEAIRHGHAAPSSWADHAQACSNLYIGSQMVRKISRAEDDRSGHRLVLWDNCRGPGPGSER